MIPGMHMWDGTKLRSMVKKILIKLKKSIRFSISILRFIYRRSKIVYAEIIMLARSKLSIMLLLHRKKPVSRLPTDYLCRSSKRALYLRLDYWVKSTTGGAMAHTCGILKELVDLGIDVLAIVPFHFTHLSALGIKQHVVDLARRDTQNDSIFVNNLFLYEKIYELINEFKPDFIYERSALGIYAGAKAAYKFKLPYIVEYNGSELILSKSYDRCDNYFIDEILDSELATFKHADNIIAVSEAIADYIVTSSVAAEKILINPNGANPKRHKPCMDNRKKIRQQFTWGENDVVVGFIGTFAGWHGVEILAKIIAEVTEKSSNIYFLLIGDGHKQSLIRDVIDKYKLINRVKLLGQIEPDVAIEYLQGCDIYISPQTETMRDTAFFGSPIKLFEYMALGQAIIASDLSQIGQIINPALRIREQSCTEINITNELGVLVKPGDIAGFVESIFYLAKHPDTRAQLGSNCREMLVDRYSWQKHVARIFAFHTENDPSEWFLPGVVSTKSLYYQALNTKSEQFLLHCEQSI